MLHASDFENGMKDSKAGLLTWAAGFSVQSGNTRANAAAFHVSHRSKWQHKGECCRFSCFAPIKVAALLRLTPGRKTEFFLPALF